MSYPSLPLTLTQTTNYTFSEKLKSKDNSPTLCYDPHPSTFVTSMMRNILGEFT